MTIGVAKAGALMRSAIRLYLILAGLMFVGGAAAGAMLAVYGYDLRTIF